MVRKRDGSQEVFARQKLLNGLLRATEKREIPLERLERAVDEIENDLRRAPAAAVTTQMVGEDALRHLHDIDRVAYVRFASVYRNFEDIDEFQRELARLGSTARRPQHDDTQDGATTAGGRDDDSEAAAQGGRHEGAQGHG